MNTPILAAIVGSVVAGVISGIVNLISTLGQYKLNRRNRRLMNEDQWRRDTISIVKELRREALHMDLGGDDQELIEDLVQEVEGQLDQAPEKFLESPVENKIRGIRLKVRKYGDDEINGPKFRQGLINKSEDVLDAFSEYSRAPSPLY
ncbi:hypothetical protein KI372_04170 [Halobacterium salinarum]|uniref:hypothetical protein n=1 Tax=Halobacterium salinarum TaxID=2242 RepID=UPI001F2C0B19|nr:hypothetical protein [Halobacterium salinarum]MCF2206355.1 hypothetical protein [Halobacterium salinarum]MCF2240613.1 hypothetical protein [Halobacterium salinarum]